MINKIKIAYDLGLNQSMYSVPKGVIQNLENNYPVKFKLINTPTTQKIYSDAEIFWGNRIDLNMANQMSKLKWIHFGSVGINRLNNFQRNNLIITSSKGLVSSAMSTNIISLIGIFSRNLNKFFQVENERPKSRDDFENYFHDLKNFDELKILILGLGDIGKFLAKNLYQLGAKVHGVSLTKKNLSFIEKELDFCESKQNLHKYDFVVSLLPENSSTKNILDFDFFSKLSKDSIFINAGRGSTCLEKDLIKSLDLGSPKTAILDVVQNEPLAIIDDIYNHPKTFVTPHIFAFSPSYWPLEINLFEENLENYLNDNYLNMKNIEYNSY
ncbi:NAD(P)-binding domain-containing protein [Prochlorococcus sp. AH-716-A09]|nr:NAD(P)-binding domain-containing protein [Prochlorococcus sp. AH-716-A09]